VPTGAFGEGVEPLGRIEPEHRIDRRADIEEAVAGLARRVVEGRIDPPSKASGPPLFGLEAQGVGERLDRMAAGDLEPHEVQQVVELAEPKWAMAYQQGQAHLAK